MEQKEFENLGARDVVQEKLTGNYYEIRFHATDEGPKKVAVRVVELAFEDPDRWLLVRKHG